MANDTPESEFSIECFQNYTAPEVFVQGLAGMVDQTDVENIIKAQKHMLQRFEKTTEMLTNCNQLSASRLRGASLEFKKHTQLLLDMKKDLEYIFKKIRAIKTKLSAQYPEAYQSAVASHQSQSVEEEDEEQPPQATKMVGTVSTETLRPLTDEKNTGKDEATNPGTSTDLQKESKVKVRSVKKTTGSSSSSETESASSGDEASSDTG